MFYGKRFWKTFYLSMSGEHGTHFSTQNHFAVIQAALNLLTENISPMLRNDTQPTPDRDPHIYTHTSHSHSHILESMATESEEKVCYRKNCFPWASHRPFPRLGSPEIPKRVLLLLEFLL